MADLKELKINETKKDGTGELGRRFLIEIIFAILGAFLPLAVNPLLEPYMPQINEYLLKLGAAETVFFLLCVVIVILLCFLTFRLTKRLTEQIPTAGWCVRVLLGALIVVFSLSVFWENSRNIRYIPNVKVSVYIGNESGSGIRDGQLEEATVLLPQSMAFLNGTVYLLDSSRVRAIRDGQIVTVPEFQDSLRAELVRTDGSRLYLCTEKGLEDEEPSAYKILRADTGESFWNGYQEGENASFVRDFAFDGNGVLWFLRNEPKKKEPETALYWMEIGGAGGGGNWTKAANNLRESATGLAFDGENVYISVPEEGVILQAKIADLKNTYYGITEELPIFAGKENAQYIKDGKDSRFCHPTSMVLKGDSLYVLDADPEREVSVIRRITVKNGKAVMTKTVAGTLEGGDFPTPQSMDASKARLPYDTVELPEILLQTDERRLLLAVPAQRAIYAVSLPTL